MSPQVMNLSHGARLLFIGLITQADDEGRGTADARRLKAAVFGGDDVESSSVRRWLDEVSSQSLCVLYESPAHGLLYELPSWRSHQSIDRPKKSGYPAPSDQGVRLLVVEHSSSVRRSVVGDRIGSDRIGSERSDQDQEPARARPAVPRSEAASGTSPPASPWPRDFEPDRFDGLNVEALADWCRYHAAMHQRHPVLPPGEASWELDAIRLRSTAGRLAATYTAAQQRWMIDRAIENGWKGIRAPRAEELAALATGAVVLGANRTWRPSEDDGSEEASDACA